MSSNFSRDLLFLYLVIALTIGQCLYFYGSSRFRAPIEPMLVLLVALMMGLLLTHEGTFLSCFALPEASSTKEDRISPSGVTSGL